MGSTNINKSLTNCIKVQSGFSRFRNFEQYDAYGNIVYYYKGENEWTVQKYRIYNVDQIPIGLVQRTFQSCNKHYTLFDENNRVINYIDAVNNCSQTNYTFYDADKNIEGSISVKRACCHITYEEFDKYGTRTNFAEVNQKCGEIPFCYESDQNGNLISKIIIFYIGMHPVLKIFDSNDMEINIGDKTIVNKGFSRIQLLIILEELLFHQE